jgi:flagellar motor component MotA
MGGIIGALISLGLINNNPELQRLIALAIATFLIGIILLIFWRIK